LILFAPSILFLKQKRSFWGVFGAKTIFFLQKQSISKIIPVKFFSENWPEKTCVHGILKSQISLRERFSIKNRYFFRTNSFKCTLGRSENAESIMPYSLGFSGFCSAWGHFEFLVEEK
jgi:hypothetical protein